MIFLGIVLAVVAATSAVAAVVEGVNHHTAVTLAMFGKSLPTTSAAGVFLVGAATACVFLLGCSIAAAGFRRGARVRRELKDLQDEHDENLQALAADKARLERQLARERGMGGQPQTMPGRQLPGPGTGPQVYPGETMPAHPFGPDTGPPRRAVHPGPAYPSHGGQPNPLTSEMFRRPQR